MDTKILVQSEIPLACDISNKKFSQKSELQNDNSHMNSEEKPFICHVCQKPFCTETVFNSHLETHLSHTDEKLFACSICELRFPDQYSLETHCLNEHISGNPFVCDTCQKIVTVECILNGHHLSQKTDKPHVCDTCQKGFDKKANLTLHLKVHTKKTFLCDVCKVEFCGKSTLERHNLYIHTSEKPFFCAFCPKRFPAKWILAQHQRLMHNSKKRFMCYVCHLGFFKKCQLNVHYRKVHT